MPAVIDRTPPLDFSPLLFLSIDRYNFVNLPALFAETLRMSTELMSQFLEGLHASRLLDSHRIDELHRRPELPQGDLDGATQFLESQGWLTRFQIDEIRNGRGQSLVFSGYRLLEEFPEKPCGRSFKAFHPALQQAVTVRLVNPQWVLPHDDLRAYIERAQRASLLTHPHALGTLDAGFAGDTPFIVQELIDGADLSQLVAEMGVLPLPLACMYLWQAAKALQAAHERGVLHGDISPTRLLLTPVVRKAGVNGSGQPISIRPAAGSVIKLTELGLIPLRPPASQVTFVQSELLGAVHYLAPERLTTADQSVKGDLYSLGATLYFLLVGRPPHQAASQVEVLLQLQQTQPPRIDTLRADIPAPLVELIHSLLATEPASRPANAGDVVAALAPYCTLETPAAKPHTASAAPLASATLTIPNALPSVLTEGTALSVSENEDDHRPMIEALPEGTSDSQIYSPRTRIPTEEEHHDDAFGTHSDAELAPLRRRRKHSKGGWIWLVLGLCLHITAITLLVLWLMGIGPFDKSATSNSDNTSSEHKAPVKKKK